MFCCSTTCIVVFLPANGLVFGFFVLVLVLVLVPGPRSYLLTYFLAVCCELDSEDHMMPLDEACKKRQHRAQ